MNNKSEKNIITQIFDKMAKTPFLMVVTACVFLFQIGMCQHNNITEKGSAITVMFWITIIAIAGIAIYFRRQGVLTDKHLIIIMIAMGVLLRYAYVLMVNSFMCQHDVGMFTGTAGGHSNYIEYWYQNGTKLPDFDVRSKWQFYQPPFHHFTMALLLRFFVKAGVAYDKACQALQLLPFIYSSLCMVVIYKIFKFFKLTAVPMLISMAIVCFHPTFIFMAGYFNNDTLSVLFMLLAVMFALKWFENPTLINIIPIALSIGFGMMTKLSAWMVAPAIAVLFIYVLIKNHKDFLKYVIQFVTFGIICIPLGIWWPVRSLTKFGIPLNYIPELGEGFDQYIGKISTVTRLFDFGNGQLRNVFLARNIGESHYFEYNPTIGLLKTAAFDENYAINPSSTTTFMTTLLFWSSVLLALICFIAVIMMLIKKKSEAKGIFRVFLGLLIAVPLISYYSFCFSYPYMCTQNIRYLVIVIPLCVLGLGNLLQNMKDNDRNKILKKVVCCIVIVFCIMSCLVYSRIGAIIPT